MKRKTYLIEVLTPLHVGAGQGLSHVDLPIMREVHTGFPFVPGSAIKGSAREYALREVWKRHLANSGVKLSDLDEEVSKGKKLKEDETKKIKDDLEYLRSVFGTAGELEEGSAGKVSFGDASILLFPVRSLSHIFLLVTCPYVISRFARTVGMDIPPQKVEDTEALCYSMEITINEKVVLEEFVFNAREAGEDFKKFVDLLGIGYKHRVVCVSDTVFSELVQNYTEVQTHVRIDPDKGTVASGALWTSEYLPAESVLFVNLFLDEDIEYSLPGEMWLGGDMTTGKGRVKIREVKT
ncbi:MAG: type III-B CRISPR module RAMP protein Cmr4 [Aquificaceae bacterium]